MMTLRTLLIIENIQRFYLNSFPWGTTAHKSMFPHITTAYAYTVKQPQDMTKWIIFPKTNSLWCMISHKLLILKWNPLLNGIMNHKPISKDILEEHRHASRIMDSACPLQVQNSSSPRQPTSPLDFSLSLIFVRHGRIGIYGQLLSFQSIKTKKMI